MRKRSADRLFPPPPPVPDDAERVKQLRQESTAALIDACHRGPEVRRTAQLFRTMRRDNGFFDLLEKGMHPR